MPSVISRSHYDPVLDTLLHTGDDAMEWAQRFPYGMLATDVETPGLDRAFTLNCVTMAWKHSDDRVHSILLDPCRAEHHGNLVRLMYSRADQLVLHNACFDVPALYYHSLLELNDVNKIVDTLVLARMAFPDPFIRKDLAALACEHLGMDDSAGGMNLAFKAAGFKTIKSGYENMDIDSPIYRQGAMADTVATLRLEPILRMHCREWLTDHPFQIYGARSYDQADELISTQEIVHRVMLRRTAVGINVNRDYLDIYSEQVSQERARAEQLLTEYDLIGGTGKAKHLLEHLEKIGELPACWPCTANGSLSATTKDLELLAHPLAAAQRTLAETDKVLDTYLAKVSHQAEVTGRCHPQVGILGASQTGRMSVTVPPYQQFSADARPIFTSDEKGDNQLWSIDWSAIEPVVMGCMAQDEKFLAPYERGEDLYEPVMRAAGIDRDTAKVVVLASMYGQGVNSMAERINASPEQAAQIRRQMLSAMPKCAKWISHTQGVAEKHGKVITASGRILAVNSKKSYAGVNFVVQGSATDVLSNAIVEMERAGLGDTIVLAMHDELVVDCNEEAAREIEQIMLVPPPFLTKWLGREPVLRCDREELGTAWKKT